MPDWSQGFSEVGARLLPEIVAQHIANRETYDVLHGDDEWIATEFDTLSEDIHESIATMADIISLSTSSFPQTIYRYFMSTVVGVLSNEKKTVFFWCGDGVRGVNGSIITMNDRIRQGVNAPPYLAYGVLPEYNQYDTDGRKYYLNIEIHDTAKIKRGFIGTDGVGDFIDEELTVIPALSGTSKNPDKQLVGSIEQFYRDNCFLEDTAITCRLRLIGEDVMNDGLFYPGLLPDDTTLIVFKRDD